MTLEEDFDDCEEEPVDLDWLLLADDCFDF